MTLKKYCTDCGSPNLYVDKVPSFCSECGNPFGSNVSKAKSKVQARKPKYIEPEEEIEEESIEIPEINKLKFKSQEFERGGVKFENIAFTKTPGENNDEFKRPPLKMTAKDILSKGSNLGGSITIGGEGNDE